MRGAFFENTPTLAIARLETESKDDVEFMAYSYALYEVRRNDKHLDPNGYISSSGARE